MNECRSILDEIEAAFVGRDVRERARILGEIADLFTNSAESYTDAEVSLFDDVMLRLVEDMEVAVRVGIARKLAVIPNAPQNLIRKLAGDDDVDIAAPILKWSERLTESDLVASASSGSQEHLLAIAERRSIPEPVTDVLLERGDRRVALSTTSNAGARISEKGHGIVVRRSRDDAELAAKVFARNDVPRQHLIRLFTFASEKVRSRLEQTHGQVSRLVRDALTNVSDEYLDAVRTTAGGHEAAFREVATLHRGGELDETRLRGYAATGDFDRTVSALSLMGAVPISCCERAMLQPRPELVMLLAKAIGLTWNTTKTLLKLRPAVDGRNDQALELLAYSRLKQETARKAIYFIQLKERAIGANRAAESGS